VACIFFLGARSAGCRSRAGPDAVATAEAFWRCTKRFGPFQEDRVAGLRPAAASDRVRVGRRAGLERARRASGLTTGLGVQIGRRPSSFPPPAQPHLPKHRPQNDAADASAPTPTTAPPQPPQPPQRPRAQRRGCSRGGSARRAATPPGPLRRAARMNQAPPPPDPSLAGAGITRSIFLYAGASPP
jgi:hypothetical protein